MLPTAETRAADRSRKADKAAVSRAVTVQQFAAALSTRQRTAAAGGFVLCPMPGCCREFTTEKLCDKHVAHGNCKISGDRHSSTQVAIRRGIDNGE